MFTETIEDYLKTIFEIQQEYGKVATTILANELKIAPASVTGMIKKLSGMGLVVYQPYQGILLTEKGRKIALQVLRHHRLVELFLVKALNMPWDLVHAEAEKLEHAISENLANRIDEHLAYPTKDPHGAPIPKKDGTIPEPAQLCLADLKPGESAIVAEVSDRDPELLRYLGDKKIYPEARITILSVEPFKGPVRIEVDNTEQVIGFELAQKIFMYQ